MSDFCSIDQRWSIICLFDGCITLRSLLRFAKSVFSAFLGTPRLGQPLCSDLLHSLSTWTERVHRNQFVLPAFPAAARIWQKKTTAPRAESEPQVSRCGNLILCRDPHDVCAICLGLKHTRQVVGNVGSCSLCQVFTTKSLRRRLAWHASLSWAAYLLSATPGNDEEQVWT